MPGHGYPHGWPRKVFEAVQSPHNFKELRLDTLWLAGIGFASGILGGLLGIGGGIVVIPSMTELLGPQQHVYQAAALMTAFFVAVPAVMQHRRAGAMNSRIVLTLLPSAVMASGVGVLLSELPVFRGAGSNYLTGVFGVFLFLMAGRELGRLLGSSRRSVEQSVGRDSNTPWWRVAVLVGWPTGLVSGLLGVGGGAVAVPLQRRVCRIGIRTAIANSSAMIVLLSVAGASAKLAAITVNHPELRWQTPVSLAACLAPAAVIGSVIGSRLTHVLPVRLVRAAFAVLLVVAGTRMVMRAVAMQ